jgi:formylglycine-generating enzyme required for sulfatase activity
MPNGGRIDMGAYGGTPFASMSEIKWLDGDVNHDGIVNFIDLAMLAENWLATAERIPFYVPSGMVLISGGTFQMGDSFNEGGWVDELPVHTVTLDSFAMGKFEVTNQQYCEYLNSALDSGSIYVSGTVVYGSGNNHTYFNTSPDRSYSQIAYSEGIFIVRTKGGRDMSSDPVVCVSWFGAVAYCNWRSQKEGREICYNTPDPNWACDFNKHGYRLPTEAEWEYAARGGLAGKRFPWGDEIDHTQANYGYNPLWNDGIYPYTSPVGSFSANGFGLYDMAGNVWEWCNDWFGAYTSNPQTNPSGPTGPTSEEEYRVLRSGGWGYNACYCRVSYREYGAPHTCDSCHVGFRCAMNIN